MKKIFIYLPVRKTSSKILISINNIIKNLKEREDIEVNVFNPLNYPIKTCFGCQNCFIRGVCDLDNTEGDYMFKLKKEMCSSDIIVFISPVYIHNVNGDMKNFLDRVGYWCHLFYLCGKTGVPIAYCDSNGGSIVYDYLVKIMSYLGLKVSKGGIYNFASSTEENLYNQDVRISNEIFDLLDGNKDLKFKKNQEIHFDSSISMYSGHNREDSEGKYWDNLVNNNINSLEALQEFIDTIYSEDR